MTFNELCKECDKTYAIWRFYHPSQKRESVKIKGGLNLQDAKDHCEDPDTKCAEWFEGFQQE